MTKKRTPTDHILPRSSTAILSRQRRERRQRANLRSKISQWSTALSLREQGYDYAEIGRQMGIGATRARDYVYDALDHIIAEPGERVRQIEQSHIERLYQLTYRVLRRGEDQHEALSGIRDILAGANGGDPAEVLKQIRDIADRAPQLTVPDFLKAVGRAVEIRESVRRLLGIDAPKRVSIDVRARVQALTSHLHTLPDEALAQIEQALAASRAQGPQLFPPLLTVERRVIEDGNRQSVSQGEPGAVNDGGVNRADQDDFAPDAIDVDATDGP